MIDAKLIGGQVHLARDGSGEGVGPVDGRPNALVIGRPGFKRCPDKPQTDRVDRFREQRWERIQHPR